MNLLMHTCCAPCSIMCIETLRDENIDPVCLWYNPNIHPFKEYQKRKRTLIDYTDSIGTKLEIINEYGLRDFIDAVYPDYDNRCGKCYLMRLFKTAETAKNEGYDAFTTTLLVSPYQNHELIIRTAEAASRKYDIQFLYRDFRKYFEEGQEKAKELGLYRQGFCGCIFSEEERYSKKRRREMYKKAAESL